MDVDRSNFNALEEEIKKIYLDASSGREDLRMLSNLLQGYSAGVLMSVDGLTDKECAVHLLFGAFSFFAQIGLSEKETVDVMKNAVDFSIENEIHKELFENAGDLFSKEQIEE